MGLLIGVWRVRPLIVGAVGVWVGGDLFKAWRAFSASVVMVDFDSVDDAACSGVVIGAFAIAVDSSMMVSGSRGMVDSAAAGADSSNDAVIMNLGCCFGAAVACWYEFRLVFDELIDPRCVVAVAGVEYARESLGDE